MTKGVPLQAHHRLYLATLHNELLLSQIKAAAISFPRDMICDFCPNIPLCIVKQCIDILPILHMFCWS